MSPAESTQKHRLLGDAGKETKEKLENKPFMGLTSFSGELPALKDIGLAKNYLEEDELKILNNLVSGYFDLAEINAIEHKPMCMIDYVEQFQI